MRILNTPAVLCLAFVLSSCRFQLAIEGEGDLVDSNGSTICTSEQGTCYTGAQCLEPGSTDFVSARAVPRPGWEFKQWRDCDLTFVTSPNTKANAVGDVCEMYCEGYEDPEVFAMLDLIAVPTAEFWRPDHDGDGFLNADDQCPTNPGPGTVTGCPPISGTDYVVVEGLAWAQPDLLSISYEQLTNVCEERFCIGILGDWDVSGWTVGTPETVGELFNAFIDSRPFTDESMSYTPTEVEKFGRSFFDVGGFRPTYTHQHYRSASAIMWGTFEPFPLSERVRSASIDHNIGSVPDSATTADYAMSPDDSRDARPVWLWRPDPGVDSDGDGKYHGEDICPLRAGDTDTGCPAITDIVSVSGKEWVQPDLFLGVDYDCILRGLEIGVIPGPYCSIVNGYDAAGWNFATADDVGALFNEFIDSSPFDGVDRSLWPNHFHCTYFPTEVEKFGRAFFDVGGFRPTYVTEGKRYASGLQNEPPIYHAGDYLPYVASIIHVIGSIPDRAQLCDEFPEPQNYFTPGAWFWRLPPTGC